jgi:hypothetical protein
MQRVFTFNYEKACTLADDESGSKWHGDRVMDFLEMRELKEQHNRGMLFQVCLKTIGQRAIM